MSRPLNPAEVAFYGTAAVCPSCGGYRRESGECLSGCLLADEPDVVVVVESRDE